MLTGMIPVTSGAAFVAGRDVNGDMANIRSTLGVCPQHDILYPDLTVREHLRMYAVLKGVPGKDLQNAVLVRTFPAKDDVRAFLNCMDFSPLSVLGGNVSCSSFRVIPF